MKALLSKIWFFILISLYIVTFVIFVVAPEYDLLKYALLGSSLGFTALMGYVYRDFFKEVSRNSFYRNLFSQGLNVLLVIFIIAMVNYLSVKKNFQFDFTKNKIHTLSEQSKKIVGSIDKDLKITLFAKRADWDRYLALLRQYASLNSRIELKAIDVETQPALVKLHNIKEDGTLLIEYQGKKTQGAITNELEVTNLLIRSLREKKVHIYYTVGHQEISRNDKSPEGASFLFQKIQDSNYNLHPFDSLKAKDVPSEADILMILGPHDGFLDMEIELFRRYIQKGGNLFIVLGPNFTGTNFQNLYSLMEENGVQFFQSLVLDRLSTVQGQSATIPIVNRYSQTHTITKNFNGRTLFPLSAALLEKKVEDIEFTSIAESSPFPASWAEKSLDAINSGKVFFEEGEDIKGPITLFSVVENKKTYNRMAFASSIVFVTNAYQNQSNNFNLFLNTLAWVVDDEGIISLNRPTMGDNMIILSASQVTLIFYFSIVFLPFAFFISAIFLYRRRLSK